MLILEYISKFIFSIFDLWATDRETTKVEMCLSQCS